MADSFSFVRTCSETFPMQSVCRLAVGKELSLAFALAKYVIGEFYCTDTLE